MVIHLYDPIYSKALFLIINYTILIEYIINRVHFATEAEMMVVEGCLYMTRQYTGFSLQSVSSVHHTMGLQQVSKRDIQHRAPR